MANESFDSKETAIAKRDELIIGLNKCETIGGRFCPLINGGCVVSCVCFGMPYVPNSHSVHCLEEQKEWYVYGHYCSNEMFYKEEYNVNSRSC